MNDLEDARRWARLLLRDKRHYWRLVQVLENELEMAGREIEELRKRLALIEQGTLSDGHGTYWPMICPRCGAPMIVVGVGSARCSAQCYLTRANYVRRKKRP